MARLIFGSYVFRTLVDLSDIFVVFVSAAECRDSRPTFVYVLNCKPFISVTVLQLLFNATFKVPKNKIKSRNYR